MQGETNLLTLSSSFLYPGFRLTSPVSPTSLVGLVPATSTAFLSNMTTPHVIASSSSHPTQSATSNGIVGNHYRVGKKIGEGSFGVVFEGTSSSHIYHSSCQGHLRDPRWQECLQNSGEFSADSGEMDKLSVIFNAALRSSGLASPGLQLTFRLLR